MQSERLYMRPNANTEGKFQILHLTLISASMIDARIPTRLVLWTASMICIQGSINNPHDKVYFNKTTLLVTHPLQVMCFHFSHVASHSFYPGTHSYICKIRWAPNPFEIINHFLQMLSPTARLLLINQALSVSITAQCSIAKAPHLEFWLLLIA